jgi:phosphoglycolate phosphatase-like HAD superfamily hydrolase
MAKIRVSLLLFDIDRTLIDTGGAGRRALCIAFFQLTGIERGTEGIIPDGKTDPLIIVEMFQRRLGRRPTDGELGKMKELYLRLLQEEIKKSKGYRVLAGVRELLEELSKDPQVLLGLGTGNFERGARIKLSRANLNRFFSFGGFGSDSMDRDVVLKIGIERGRELARISGKEVEAVYVVGDTPYDIEAGKRVGARVIAVASGKYSISQLEAAHPDFILKSLELKDEFIRIIKEKHGQR